jgi:hypothetical protein
MTSALEEFIAGNKGFNERDFLSLFTNTPCDKDPAVRAAIFGHAALAVLLPQIKRRQKESAALEAGRHLEGGYGIARYVLGTYKDQIRYSTESNCDQIAGDLSTKCDSYDFDSVVGALHPDARELILGSSQISARQSVLGKALGLDAARALCFSQNLYGIRLALAESDSVSDR